MAIKSCLMKNDMALTGAAVKAHPPASSGAQKLVEKQEKMYHSLSKDTGFQKDIVGLKRMDKITAIQKKYANNGVNISRKKINQMMKSGVTVAKSPPIVMPKPPPVAPGVIKPPPIIPKPPPKIVSVPKEPIPKVVPVKPIPKELLAEFKEAKTLDEAMGEWGKYGHGNPMTGNFTKDWSQKKKLETMNRMNAQMNDMQKWIRGRKLGGVSFDDGDQKWNGKSIQNTGMGFNKVTLNHRNSFKKYGYGEKSAGKLGKSWFNVSEGNASITLRHETGHALWFDSPSANLRIEFTNRYKVLKKAVIEENISKYAAKNAKEFFAESFAKYSSPQYKVGSLNKVFGSGFEELMEKILVSDRKPLQVAKPLAKIIKPVAKKVAKKGVKFANAANQKTYDNFYKEFMEDPKLNSQKSFVNKMEKEISRNMRKTFDDWKEDSGLDSSMALKMKAEKLEAGMSATRFGERTSKIKMDRFRGIENEIQDKEYMRVRALNQAYVDKVKKSKDITLFRGTDGESGKRYVRKVEVMGNKPIMITDNSLVGYTTDRSVADGFGVGRNGITTRVKFKSKDIFLHDDIWPKNLEGTHLHRKEKEYICIGGPKKVMSRDIFIDFGEEWDPDVDLF